MTYAFLFLMLIGTIFIDLPTAKIVGTIGKSLMFLIAPIITFLIFTFSSNSLKNLLSKFDIKLFLFYWIITFFISILILYFNMIFYGVYSIYNLNLFIKLLKASTYNLIFAFAYFNFSYIFKNINYSVIKNTIILVFIFLTLIGILEIYNKDIFSILHNKTVEYSRLRLLTSEPSQAGLVYGVFLFLSVFFIKRWIFRFIIFLFGLFIFYFIGSKGALLNIVLSFAIVYFFGLNFKNKLKSLVYLTPLFFIFFNFYISVFISDLITDINNFTSFSTRFIGFISALLTLIFYPFGTGYGTYLNFFPDIAERAKLIVLNMFPFPLNFSELDFMMASGENIGFKSGVLSQILFNGWIAVFFYIILFISSYKKIIHLNLTNFQSLVLKSLVIFVFLEITLSVDIEVMYAYILPLALITSKLFEYKLRRV